MLHVATGDISYSQEFAFTLQHFKPGHKSYVQQSFPNTVPEVKFKFVRM